ncbi:MAG: hypothetical protein ACPLRZ_08295 [Thermovenabulum sp.]|uniref:hypothetical protein n=1 Tax=Thermovenabulum sp. TaxID=3100335 RepID=UPI003C79F5A8
MGLEESYYEVLKEPNAQVMAWFMDEFSEIKGYNTPGIVTGKPIILGGSRI